MSLIIYDTETTNLPLRAPKGHQPIASDHPDQPHIVELGLILCNDDGTEILSWGNIIRPDGWVIPEETVKIHGVSQEHALADGVPEHHAVACFVMALQSTYKPTVRVCHNPYFDEKIMRIAMLRAGFERGWIERLTNTCPTFDTCRASLKLVNLPPTEKMMARGMKSPKPPSLEEATKHFFGTQVADAHSALGDARACARLYFELKRLESAPLTAAQPERQHDDAPAV